MAAAETPGISVGEIAKAIGEMWRGLSEQDKKPHQVCLPSAACLGVEHRLNFITAQSSVGN